MIYLDNAATTYKKPECVKKAVIDALSGMGNCARGAHGGALSAARAIHQVRELAAELFHCQRPDHVILTANSTEALNIAINGLINPGDHVIATDLEHNSVLRPLYRLRDERNVSVDFLPADKQGRLDYTGFEAAIRPETKAIVTTHASNLTGNILDIERIGAIAEKHGLLYIVDASQTAGSFDIDMQKQHISVLCFTGHKGLMGPQGTGGLCIAEGVHIRPFKVGGTGVHSFSETQPDSYPEALEAGTMNGHGLAGLAAGLEYIIKTGTKKIHAHEISLMHRFAKGVRDIPGVILYGDFSGDRAPIATINIGNLDSAYTADILAQEFDIAVRAGAHCAPRMHHALGTEKQGAVRFSFGWFNTADEVDSAISAVRNIAEE